MKSIALSLALVALLAAGLPAAPRARAADGLQPPDRYQLTLAAPPGRGPLLPVASVLQFIRLQTIGVIRPRPGATFRVIATAYSSTVAQTDATPCITAAGTRVRHGIVATNFLPLGTVMRIAGNEFVVSDRMNQRYNGKFIIDVWHPTTAQAREFGARPLVIEIIRYQSLDELRQREAETVQRLRAPAAAEPRVESLRDRLQRALDRLRSFAGGRLVVPEEEDCLALGS